MNVSSKCWQAWAGRGSEAILKNEMWGKKRTTLMTGSQETRKIDLTLTILVTATVGRPGTGRGQRTNNNTD